MCATQCADYALLGVVEGFASALRIEVGEEVATLDVAIGWLPSLQTVGHALAVLLRALSLLRG